MEELQVHDEFTSSSPCFCTLLKTSQTEDLKFHSKQENFTPSSGIENVEETGSFYITNDDGSYSPISLEQFLEVPKCPSTPLNLENPTPSNEIQYIDETGPSCPKNDDRNYTQIYSIEQLLEDMDYFPSPSVVNQEHFPSPSVNQEYFPSPPIRPAMNQEYFVPPHSFELMRPHNLELMKPHNFGLVSPYNFGLINMSQQSVLPSNYPPVQLQQNLEHYSSTVNPERTVSRGIDRMNVEEELPPMFTYEQLVASLRCDSPSNNQENSALSSDFEYVKITPIEKKRIRNKKGYLVTIYMYKRFTVNFSSMNEGHYFVSTRFSRHVNMTVADTMLLSNNQGYVKVLYDISKYTELRSCAACGEPISDRYFLEVGGCSWHGSCLRCCVCLSPLDRQQSCFLKERQVYCKTDYAKNFGAKCSKCCRGISASDWVRRARELVFHLACFACDSCGRQLSTGEQFALMDDRVLCKSHYLETIEGGTTSSDDGCDGDGYHKNKTKRVRTTFTEEQLQVLQANFQIDSNPDGQDLERIASVTGLSKRVTQVWFQNSRARQKKHIHAGKNKMVRDADGNSFARHINLQLTYSFQNNSQNPMQLGNGKSSLFPSHDSSLDELSQDSASIHCMPSEV